MDWTQERITALKPDERGRLHTNARAQGTEAGDALALMIEEAGLPFSEGGGINMDDPLVQAIAAVVQSTEGREACERAVAEGHPAIAGVDPLIADRLGVDYGAHNMTTNSAGFLVAEMMRSLGYRALGRKGKTPPGSVAGSGEMWEPSSRA